MEQIARILVYKDGNGFVPTIEDVQRVLNGVTTKPESIEYDTENGWPVVVLDGNDSGFEDVRDCLAGYFVLGGDEACPDCGHALVDGKCLDQQQHAHPDNWSGEMRARLSEC